MATMEEFLALIRNATDDQLKAFKAAMPKDESFSPISEEERKAEEERLTRMFNLEQDRAEVLQKSSLLMNDINKAKEQEAIAMQKQVELALQLEVQRIAAVKEETDAAKKKQAEEVAQLEFAIKQVKAGKEITADLALNNDILLDMLDKYEDIVPAQQAINDLTSETKNNIDDLVKGMGSFVGLTDKVSSSKIGKMTQLFETIGKGGEDGAAATELLTRQMSKMFSVQNIAMNVGTKIFKESMKVLNAFDQGLATLAGKTGTVGKFNDVLYDTQRAGNLLGVSMEGAANAIIALNAGTSQFAKLSKQTQTDLAISTSQMETLGISASDTAEFMENAFKIMGMGATEAIETQTELAMAGVQLGIGADKIVKDFNAASKTLAVYGKGSIKVFKGLAAQAKAAGVEVSTLLGIVQKFDTFSGAAEGAAHFNALLGTQLSTTQMLMMTEDERMKTLIQQVQAQGVAFGDMDRFTQKSIAAAAGITDMNEANRIFSMSLADYEANSKELANNAEAQKKFDDAVQATVPTMKKFQNLATELIVMVQPALEKLGEIADYLTDAFQNMGKETKEALGTAAMAIAGILVVAPLFAVGGGFMAGLAAIGPAIAGIGAGVATAAAAISGIAMTGIGAAALGALALAGGGIAVAMVSMSKSKAKMAESNAKMVSEGSDTIKAMADIGNADFSGIATKFRGAMQELSKMGSDVKVTSTLQNLALIGSSTAFDMTGAKIAASSTNVTANVSNVFDGMKLTLEAGGQQFEAYIKDVAATTAMS